MVTVHIRAWCPEKAWGSACGYDRMLLLQWLRPALVQRGTEVKRIASRILKKEVMGLQVKDFRSARSISSYLVPFGAEIEVEGGGHFEDRALTGRARRRETVSGRPAAHLQRSTL